MKIMIKPGAVLLELNSHLFHVAYTVHSVWQKRGQVPILTSASEGKHKDGSLHYKGLAWDFRAWNIPDPEKATEELSNLLNISGHLYDVLLESKTIKDPKTGKDQTVKWIHVEYDPKTGVKK